MGMDLSVFKLITDASLLVQIVIGILILASIVSWTLIILKISQFKRAQREAISFEDRFWSGISLRKLYDDLLRKQYRQGMERIFFDGYHEYHRLSERNTPQHLPVIDAAQRAMRVADSRELDRLEQHLSFLATVGSISPYVGLFGTVWGIMNSFMHIGQMKQATLAVVAPGIAEALIATAIGLFAAIPAVVAYNKFSDSLDRLTVSYENFREEFISLLERHLLTSKNKTTGQE